MKINIKIVFYKYIIDMMMYLLILSLYIIVYFIKYIIITSFTKLVQVLIINCKMPKIDQSVQEKF